MGKKLIRLTETELIKLVSKIIREQEEDGPEKVIDWWTRMNPSESKIYNELKTKKASEGFRTIWPGEPNLSSDSANNYSKIFVLGDLDPNSKTYFAKTDTEGLVGIYDNQNGKEVDLGIKLILPDEISARSSMYSSLGQENLINHPNNKFYVENGKWVVELDSPLDLVMSKTLLPGRKLGTILQPKQPKTRQ